MGDTLTVTTRCLWNKNWSPYASLPKCIITHCIKPYPIPGDSLLEEVTSDWTSIRTSKAYQCMGKTNGKHTRFFETDRSLSMFTMFCQADGLYNFVDQRINWPTCLEDITCIEYPPEIPTNEEYILPSDDGKVTIEALIYPSLQNIGGILNSTHNFTDIPRNYNTNLTYTCGSARKFLKTDGKHLGSISMNCKWDKTWNPSNDILPCDWVSCLRPPEPPNSTNLKITDWDGLPVPFANKIIYVCDRGMNFEHDMNQENQIYHCQNKTTKKTERGFFDTPKKDEDWPVCVEGCILSFLIF